MTIKDLQILKILKREKFYVQINGVEIQIRDVATKSIWLEYNMTEDDNKSLGELILWMVGIQIEQDKDEDLPHYLPQLMKLQTALMIDDLRDKMALRQKSYL